MNRVEKLRDTLVRNGIKVTQPWVKDCAAFFLQQNPGISDDKLYEDCIEQYNLADLVEVGLAVLPEQTQTQKTAFILEGVFVLQMNYIINVSESPYDQLRHIHDNKLDEAETDTKAKEQRFAPKKKRMLKLELTDGHRKVVAMEYRPIPVLNTKLPPGYKLKITGPLKVINKVLLLEPKNVKLLGGEVDTLLIPNALENLLLKTLGEPLVDNPKMDYAEDKVQEDRCRSSPNLGITPMTMSKPPEPVFQPSISSNSIINNFVMDDEDDLLLGSINLDIQCENNIVPVSEPTTASTFAFENDEDDMEMLLAMENIDNNHPNPMDVDENFIAEQLVEAPRSSSTFSSNNSRPPNTSTAQSLPQTPSSNSFTDINYGFKIKGNNLLTIDQLSTLDNFAITRDFVLYSAIDGPCDKFKIVNKKWFFSVFLKDAYSQELYKAHLDDEIMSELLGCSAIEFGIMKKEMITRPQIKEDMIEMIQLFNNRLNSIECFMKLSFDNQEFPTITELIISTQPFQTILSDKVRQEGLRIV